jgi:hypothetical protein
MSVFRWYLFFRINNNNNNNNNNNSVALVRERTIPTEPIFFFYKSL